MILADTAVWIGHLRVANPMLQGLLVSKQILGHPLVAGELSVGNLRDRLDFLQSMDNLPRSVIADNGEVRHFVEMHGLFSRGVGFVDLHLLLSVRLTPGALLWTRDRRLHEIATEMSVAFVEMT